MGPLNLAFRSLRAGRWASLTAVLALAVGIGSSLTAATVAYSGLLRPLPFPNDQELVTLKKEYAPVKGESGLGLRDFDEWRRRLAPMCRLVASASERATLRNAATPLEVRMTYVLGPYFETLGIRPLAGRLLLEQDDRVAVVSRRFAARFAGSPDAAISRPLVIGDRTLRIVGVAPDALSVLDHDVDAWAPAASISELRVFGDRGDERDYSMVARLLPGASMERVRAIGLQLILEKIPDTAETAGARKGWQMHVGPLRRSLLGDLGPTLLIIGAAALLLLFIATANAAMLLAYRAVARGHEFGVRLALGAGRGRLIGSTLLETALLAAGGVLTGFWIAASASRWLGSQTGLSLPRLTTFNTTWLLAVGAVVSMLFVLGACSLAPILIATRSHLTAFMRSTTSSGSRTHRRVQAALIMAQFAMTTMLIAGVGLLGRTLIAVGHTDLGVAPAHHVVTMRLPLGQSTRPPAERNALVNDILSRVRAMPGVVVAGIGSSLPPHDAAFVMTIRYISQARDVSQKFDAVSVTDGYLDALGVQLVAGRLFRPEDGQTTESLGVLGEAPLAHSLMGKDSVGKQFNVGIPTGDGKRARPKILGVIRDVRFSGPTAPPNGGIYVPWRQIPVGTAYLVARTSGDPAAIVPALPAIVRSVDPSMPLAGAKTFDAEMNETLAPWTARFALFATFGLGAGALAIVGIFGALAHSVVERRRELAIRGAIGAAPSQLRNSVLARGLLWCACGVTIGLLLSAAGAEGISTVIFGVRPHDPTTYALTAVGVLAMGLVGAYVPGRRAAAADPAELLRSE